jgi:hypothetical protein
MTTNQMITKAIEEKAREIAEFNHPVIMSKFEAIKEMDSETISELIEDAKNHVCEPGPRFIDATKRKIINQLIERLS